MTVFLSPVGNSNLIDANGAPLSGGTIDTFAAGTSTPVATYTDNTGGTPQTNPIVLNTLGLPPSPIWLTSGQSYKFVIKDSAGNLIETVDNIAGINDVPSAFNGDAVRSLVGAPNAATPLTKYDLQAGAVTLRNSSNATVVQLNTATITCNLGLAGPTANGRDQSAAFTANSWVYLYFIWSGTTLATLASATAPASFTGATLPTGYTYWAFATALRWNVSSNIPTCYARGSKVFYAATLAVLSAGTAIVDTSVSTAATVPPNALTAFVTLLFNNLPTASAQTAILRLVGGSTYTSLDTEANGIGVYATEIPNIAQSFIYTLTVATSPLTVTVRGYSVPNGDS